MGTEAEGTLWAQGLRFWAFTSGTRCAPGSCPSRRYLRELEGAGKVPWELCWSEVPFWGTAVGVRRCRAAAAGAGFGAFPRRRTGQVREAGAGLDFLVVLAIMLSVASMKSLYFLTPTCVFTSLSYLSELKGLFHEKKFPGKQALLLWFV